MIYIMCPANLATGGPEVLHQLGYKLNLLGIEANMYYYNTKAGVDPVCEVYRKYNVPYSAKIDATELNTVIVPEGVITLVHQLKNCRVVVWWLSVDYAKYTDEDVEYMRGNSNIYHLVQSKYALEHLNNKLNITKNVYYLSDYLNSAFFDPTIVVNDNERENVVLFNPKKGVNKTASIVFSSDYRIKWQALYGLTPEGMRQVMRKAKVYIDFGEHPGKDRIPREAAMCGCCVITNRNGSAANDTDVIIPDKYKFDNDGEFAPIFNCIHDIFDNFEERKKDFIPYAKKISREFNEFEQDIVKFFALFYPDRIIDLNTPDDYAAGMIEAIQEGDYCKALLFLVNYRIKGYEENAILDILEVAIRMGINELAEARICAFRGLEKEPDNYELYLNLVQISVMTGDRNNCDQYAKLALEYSKGTPDWEYVSGVLSELGY